MKRIQWWGLLLLLMALGPWTFAQQRSAPMKEKANRPTQKPLNLTQQANFDEYIELIRSNVRQEKAQILGAVMALSAADATKFWPIYYEYDNELAKLNKMRSDNILQYAKAYDTMTDEKADALIATAIQYEKQRTDLLAKYYATMKDALGAVEAARFLQIEHQLLLLIDLQLASNLPIVEEKAQVAQGAK